MAATISTALAMIGIAGVSASATVAKTMPMPPPLIDEECQETEADLGLETIADNHCQRLAIVANSPAEMAAAYAGEVVKHLAGWEMTWAEIQIDYRRFAKEQGWRLELADRILSGALKDAGCIREQRDLRKEKKGRPIFMIIPWRDE